VARPTDGLALREALIKEGVARDVTGPPHIEQGAEVGDELIWENLTDAPITVKQDLSD
jgi:hypothetical protein